MKAYKRDRKRALTRRPWKSQARRAHKKQERLSGKLWAFTLAAVRLNLLQYCRPH